MNRDVDENFHPVEQKAVMLSRDDIVKAYCSISGKEWAIGGMDDALPFARAIEAKAREQDDALLRQCLEALVANLPYYTMERHPEHPVVEALKARLGEA